MRDNETKPLVTVQIFCEINVTLVERVQTLVDSLVEWVMKAWDEWFEHVLAVEAVYPNTSIRNKHIWSRAPCLSGPFSVCHRYVFLRQAHTILQTRAPCIRELRSLSWWWEIVLLSEIQALDTHTESHPYQHTNNSQPNHYVIGHGGR